MKQRLKTILLIDDDAPTNFIHELYIKETGLTERVITMQDAAEALEYLKELAEKDQSVPELILLDINMPGMDGWEFLEEYDKLDKDIRAKMLVLMVTTSLNPADEARARKNGNVNDYLTKPLDQMDLKNIVHKFFPNLEQSNT